jgi:hypothetical protein
MTFALSSDPWRTEPEAYHPPQRTPKLYSRPLHRWRPRSALPLALLLPLDLLQSLGRIPVWALMSLADPGPREEKLC